MTPVDRPVVRRTGATVRDGGRSRELVITVHRTFITLRPIGTRREETIQLEAAYFRAIKDRVWRAAMVKAQAKVERKRVRR